MTPPLREKHDGMADDRSALRLWLRLLSCTMIVEKRIKRRFAERFATTLPRFDVLAALDRAPDGLAMSALSRALLVSNGNVTALVQALQRDGLVELTPSGSDRRVSIVRLTAAGAAHFAALAAAHHHWIEAIFAGIEPPQREALLELLDALKLSIALEEKMPT
jgi:DNA-binding MarR family transcriptional regulator